MARAQAEAMLHRNLGDTTFMNAIIMGYQGEMSLKGLNRNQFASAMMKILRYRLQTVGKFKVYCTQSTFYMEPEEEDVDMDLAFDRVSKVFSVEIPNFIALEAEAAESAERIRIRITDQVEFEG